MEDAASLDASSPRHHDDTSWFRNCDVQSPLCHCEWYEGTRHTRAPHESKDTEHVPCAGENSRRRMLFFPGRGLIAALLARGYRRRLSTTDAYLVTRARGRRPCLRPVSSFIPSSSILSSPSSNPILTRRSEPNGEGEPECPEEPGTRRSTKAPIEPEDPTNPAGLEDPNSDRFND